MFVYALCQCIQVIEYIVSVYVRLLNTQCNYFVVEYFVSWAILIHSVQDWHCQYTFGILSTVCQYIVPVPGVY